MMVAWVHLARMPKKVSSCQMTVAPWMIGIPQAEEREREEDKRLLLNWYSFTTWLIYEQKKMYDLWSNCIRVVIKLMISYLNSNSFLHELYTARYTQPAYHIPPLCT